MNFKVKISSLNINGDISKWDVSSVLYMPEMFMYANLFDQNISSWDVSSVINVRTMFLGALAFNQDISGWDTTMLLRSDVATLVSQ